MSFVQVSGDAVLADVDDEDYHGFGIPNITITDQDIDDDDDAPADDETDDVEALELEDYGDDDGDDDDGEDEHVHVAAVQPPKRAGLFAIMEDEEEDV